MKFVIAILALLFPILAFSAPDQAQRETAEDRCLGLGELASAAAIFFNEGNSLEGYSRAVDNAAPNQVQRDVYLYVGKVVYTMQLSPRDASTVIYKRCINAFYKK